MDFFGAKTSAQLCGAGKAKLEFRIDIKMISKAPPLQPTTPDDYKAFIKRLLSR